VLEAPLRHQPWTDRRTAVERRSAEQPQIDAVLRPGDCLYLPRGYLHAATALGGVSTHLTLGVHSWTRYGMANQLVQLALRTAAGDPELRVSLPLGIDVTDAGDLSDHAAVVRERLIEALWTVDDAALAAALAPAARAGQRAAPIGPLRQLTAADQLHPATRLVVRPHLAATVSDRSDGGLTVVSRAGTVTISGHDRAAFAGWWHAGSGIASELGIDLARTVLTTGLAVPG
jgi:hypothetical protein